MPQLRTGVLIAALALACTGGAALGAAGDPAAPAARPAPSGNVARGEEGPVWATLTPAQQTTLAPLRTQWSTLDASRKAKWLVVASRFPSMPVAERDRVQARMTEWARMSPSERGRARQNFQELRNLPAGDRQALWDAYRALPEDQRRALAQRSMPAASAADARVPGKRNVVNTAAQMQGKAVSPTVVQAKPGATTTLVTRRPAPPVHHQPGLPKIAATEGFVNPSTLLPSRGPQGAAAVPVSASSPDPGL